MKLPDGRVVLIEPDWVGKLAGFTLPFGALILAMARHMPFSAVAELANLSWRRVHAICSRYVDMALKQADLSAVTHVAIDETSGRRGHDDITLAADMRERSVVFLTKGRDSETMADFGERKGGPEQVKSVSIDVSAAFIKGIGQNLREARITFDKFHVVAHASKAVDEMRRLEQRTDPSLKGIRWALLKDREDLSEESRARSSNASSSTSSPDCSGHGATTSCDRRSSP